MLKILDFKHLDEHYKKVRQDDGEVKQVKVPDYIVSVGIILG